MQRGALNECLPGGRVSVFPSCISRSSSLSSQARNYVSSALKIYSTYVSISATYVSISDGSFWKSVCFCCLWFTSTSWQAHLCYVFGSLLSFLHKWAGLCLCYVSGSLFPQVGRPLSGPVYVFLFLGPLSLEFRLTYEPVLSTELGSFVLLDSDV